LVKDCTRDKSGALVKSAQKGVYAGALLHLFGTPLALGSYWGFLALAAMTPFLIWRLFDEERFLSKNLPGYAEYCARVRWRLIPGVF
jgi:protein-S-isoprenylcysteine O-methyltransferase Ste14